MAKYKTNYACQECGYESPKWMGKCPGCNSWNTLVEEVTVKAAHRHEGLSGGTRQSAIPLTQVASEEEPRMDTTIGELNRVLGGGLVPGSLILVGGDPGIGKSTLLLQTSFALAHQGAKAAYADAPDVCIGRK